MERGGGGDEKQAIDLERPYLHYIPCLCGKKVFCYTMNSETRAAIAFIVN